MRKTLLLILLLIPLAGYGQSWQIGASVGTDYNSAHRTYINPYQKQDVRGGFSPSYNLTFSREYKNSDLLSISLRYSRFVSNLKMFDFIFAQEKIDTTLSSASPQIDISYHKNIVTDNKNKLFLGAMTGFGMKDYIGVNRQRAYPLGFRVWADFHIPIGLSAMYQYSITEKINLSAQFIPQYNIYLNNRAGQGKGMDYFNYPVLVGVRYSI